MMMRTWIVALIGCLLSSAAVAQGTAKTAAALNTEIASSLASGQTPPISASTLRQVVLDMVATAYAPQGSVDSTAGFSSPNFVVNSSGNLTALNITSNQVIASNKQTDFGVGSASGSTNSALFFNNNATGTCTDTGSCYLNLAVYSSETVNASASSNGLTDFWWNSNTGGAGAAGGRIGSRFTLTVNGATTGTVGNYQVQLSEAQASVNLGGIAGGGSNGKGSLFGINPNARLVSGATFWHQLIGGEVDISIASGASADNMVGFQIVMPPGATVAPTTIGIGYSINNNTGTAGWDIGFADGSYDGNPALKTTGTLMKCYPHAGAGNCGTIGAGVDLSNYSSITGNAFASPGFSVNGSGQITVPAGSPGNPSILFTGSATSTGIYTNAVDNVSISLGGQESFRSTVGAAYFFYGDLDIYNTTPRLGFGAAPDVYLQRSAAGILEVNTGTLGVYSDLRLRLLQTTVVAVGSLTACNIGAQGSRHMVNNATATTFASIVAGAGGNIVPVYCDGTNWRIG